MSVSGIIDRRQGRGRLQEMHVEKVAEVAKSKRESQSERTQGMAIGGAAMFSLRL